MKKPFVQFVLVGGLLAGAAFLFFVNPGNVAYPPCLFKKFTGWQCPGCGSARACYHLLHGDLFSALDYNLLLTLFMPFLTLEVLSRIFSTGARLPVRFRLVQNHVRARYILVIVLIFWIARNLPVHPFRFLSSDG